VVSTCTSYQLISRDLTRSLALKADDGTITQNGKPIGALGLFSIPENSRLDRGPNASVIPSQSAQPVEDLTNNGVHRGYLEGANVNSVLEMSRLIGVTHPPERVPARVPGTTFGFTASQPSAPKECRRRFFVCRAYGLPRRLRRPPMTTETRSWGSSGRRRSCRPSV
jgi:Flagellar basal body rod FlgEFG protein C-terminal